MTAASIRADGVTTAVGSNSTTWNVGMPDTVEPTDQILVIIQPWSASTAPTASRAGWTTLQNDPLFTDRTLQFLVKDTVTGSEDGTTEAFTIDNSSLGTAVALAIVGADDPANWVFATLATATGSASPDPPSNTSGLGAVDTLWLAVAAAFDDDATFNAFPANYTHYQDQVQSGGGTNNGNELGVAARQLNAASENPGTFTLSESENWAAQTLAIGPGGVTVTPERADVVLTADSPTAVVSIQPERAVLTLTARTPAVVAVVGPAPLPFAEGGHTNPRIEVALNHATAASPTDWIWTDWSARLESRIGDLQIGTNRGRSDESADTEPSQLGPIILDNGDGALTPEFAMSPYYPAVDVGLPMRYWEDGLTPALLLPGSVGAYAFSPDHADFDITGDLDVRIRVEPNAWSIGVTIVDGATVPTNSQRLASKWLAPSDSSWTLSLYDAGWAFSEWSTNGTSTAGFGNGFPTLIAALGPIWLGWTFDVDDGAGNNVHTFYRYDGDDPPPDDITTWTVVDVDVNAGATSMFSGAGQLELGSRSAGAAANFGGRIDAFELRDGINGTLAANPDFTSLEPGTTSFVDGVGKSWQLAGAAQISRRRLRFCGEVTEIDPFWPYGDNQPLAGLDDDRPSEARAAITAAGVLRRLTTGQDPLRSSLARKIVSEPDNVIAYWPCEDGRQAAQFGAGLPGVEAMVTTGLDMASDTTLPASDALPKVAAGDAATWSGAVPAGPTDAWAIEMALFIETPETDPTTTQILAFTGSGTIARWTIEISDTAFVVTAYDSSGGVIDTNATGVIDIFGQWALLRFEASQDGADVDWAWTLVSIDTGGGGGNSDTIAGETIGYVASIDTEATGPPDGMSFGHIIVQDAALAVGWLRGADTAWVGESAAHRFWRLCTEEGVPVEIIGDPAAGTGTRGDLLASQAMGLQGRKTLAELLSECVAIDMGVLMENTGIPGLIFRLRIDIEDQDPRLVLDATNNEIEDLQPKRDNQGLVNEIQVTSTGGASAVAVDEASRAKRGRYSDSIEIAGVGGLDIQDAILGAQVGLADAVDTQNLQQASWRLTLGTADGMRYASLTIDLGTAPHLIETWLATALGDRVTLTGLPVQHPSDTVELLLQHAAETTSPTAWILELTFSPGEPWLLGELT